MYEIDARDEDDDADEDDELRSHSTSTPQYALPSMMAANRTDSLGSFPGAIPLSANPLYEGTTIPAEHMLYSHLSHDEPRFHYDDATAGEQSINNAHPSSLFPKAGSRETVFSLTSHADQNYSHLHNTGLVLW